jgi:hypothetical protein
MVWWLFGLFATVAAGYSWLPFSSFLASIIQFGITSWLFLYLPKLGKAVAILISLIMCIWPVVGFISYLNEKEPFFIIYFIIVFCLCITVIFNHFRTIREEHKPNFKTRIILSLVPFLVFMLYILTTYKYFI